MDPYLGIIVVSVHIGDSRLSHQKFARRQEIDCLLWLNHNHESDFYVHAQCEYQSSKPGQQALL